MIVIRLTRPDDLATFRAAVRGLIATDADPADVTWLPPGEADLLPGDPPPDGPPVPAPAAALEASEAVALVAGDPCAPAPHDLGEPLGPLVPNPLYEGGELRWPSERYAQEYGPRADYLPERWPESLPPDAARRRLLVDLPERW